LTKFHLYLRNLYIDIIIIIDKRTNNWAWLYLCRITKHNIEFELKIILFIEKTHLKKLRK